MYFGTKAYDAAVGDRVVVVAHPHVEEGTLCSITKLIDSTTYIISIPPFGICFYADPAQLLRPLSWEIAQCAPRPYLGPEVEFN